MGQYCELTRRYAQSLVVKMARHAWFEYLMTLPSH
jgi:hypothetical protein